MAAALLLVQHIQLRLKAAARAHAAGPAQHLRAHAHMSSTLHTHASTYNTWSTLLNKKKRSSASRMIVIVSIRRADSYETSHMCANWKSPSPVEKDLKIDPHVLG